MEQAVLIVVIRQRIVDGVRVFVEVLRQVSWVSTRSTLRRADSTAAVDLLRA